MTSSGIRYNDRTFVGGRTGSGKSVLLNHVAAGFRCQRFLYDTKDEFTVPGVPAVHRVGEVDWELPVVHYIDDDGDLKDTQKVFRTLWQRKVGRSDLPYGLVVVVHELADLCGDQPGATPPAASNYARKGRAHGLGAVYGSQRPRNIPRVWRTECDHVISMAQGFDPEDIPIMAGMHGMTVGEYERALAQALTLGDYAYVWGDRRARTNVIRPPLPEGLLRQTLAQGIDPRRRRTAGELPESSPSLPESSGSSPGELPENVESAA